MSFSTTPPRNDYVGNGAVVTYAFGFRIFAATDLKVTVQTPAGVETALTYPTDFTVPATSINNANGGTITLINASILSGGFLITGYLLSIRFFQTTNQPTDLRNQGGFFLEVIEDLFDRVVRFVQQGEDKINRSLHITETETPSEAKTLLPTVTNRKSKFLAFDASGNPIATAAVVSTVPLSTFMQTVADDADAAAVLTTLLAEELSPAQITANQDNYNPASLSTVNVLRINTDASRNITGLAGGVDGRLLFWWNVGSFNAVLVSESGSSTAGNRFALSGDITLIPNAGILLRYDGVSSRWRNIGGSIEQGLLTTEGDVIVRGSSGPQRLAIGSAGTVPMVRSAASGKVAYVAALNKAIYGLTYANNGADAVNDIDFAAGGAMDATGAYFMVANALTKQSDVAWAVGNNAGMLDTGAVGNSDYYVWSIVRSDTGVVDYLASLSSTAPAMPPSYDFKRLISWFKRVGGTIVAFTTYETEGGGLELLWSSPTLDINLAATLTTLRRTDAVKVPLNFSTIANLNVHLDDVAGGTKPVWIYCPDQADLAPSASVAPLSNFDIVNLAAPTFQSAIYVRTSATGTIAARATVATIDQYSVVTVGFRWARRN